MPLSTASKVAVAAAGIGVAGLSIATMLKITAGAVSPMTGGIGEWMFPSSWDSYFQESDLQTWQRKFGWNLIRLSMDVEQLAGIPPWTPQFPTYDEAISAASKYGYRVILSDFTFTGSPPSSDMTDWLKAWQIVAQHYAGDQRIAVYEVANELEHSTTTNQVLSTVVSEIRAIDPSRLMAIWQYSPSKSDGTACYPNCPPSCGLNLPGGIFTAYHPSTYILDQNRKFAGCRTDSDVDSWINSFLSFGKSCGLPPLVCEINAQDSQCNPTSVYLIQRLIANNIPYCCWGWTAYRNNWDAILGSV
jgi:hypothetical protein